MYVCLRAQLVSSEKAFKGSHHRNSQEALQLVVAQHQYRISQQFAPSQHVNAQPDSRPPTPTTQFTTSNFRIVLYCIYLIDKCRLVYFPTWSLPASIIEKMVHVCHRDKRSAIATVGIETCKKLVEFCLAKA